MEQNLFQVEKKYMVVNSDLIDFYKSVHDNLKAADDYLKR